MFFKKKPIVNHKQKYTFYYKIPKDIDSIWDLFFEFEAPKEVIALSYALANHTWHCDGTDLLCLSSGYCLKVEEIDGSVLKINTGFHIDSQHRPLIGNYVARLLLRKEKVEKEAAQAVYQEYLDQIIRSLK